MAPLGILSLGDQAEILEIKSQRGCSQGEIDSLCHAGDMGLRIGKKVEVLNNAGRGPILVMIDESRIAIGRGMAMLKPGEKGRILKIWANGPVKRRLMDMGVLVGETVKVEKIAPLGDPIEVLIKSYNLSLRKREAEEISVEAIE